MSNPTEPKRQHYVPRFYLEYFAKVPDRKQLHVLEVKTGQAFVTNVTNVAVEGRLYNTPDGGSVEKDLNEIEGATAPAWAHLNDCTGLSQLCETDRQLIAGFVSSLIGRNPSTLTDLGEIVGAIKKAFEDSTPTEELARQIEQFDRGKATRIMNDITKDSHRLVHYILNKKWILGTPPAGYLFPTSDNPVVRSNSFRHGHGTLGLASSGVEIYLPVSPQRVLMMVDVPQDLQQLCPEQVAFEYPHLLHVTSLLVWYSNRHLFNSDGRFEVAKGMKQAPKKLTSD